MIDDISISLLKHFQRQFLVKSLGRVTQVVISFAQKSSSTAVPHWYSEPSPLSFFHRKPFVKQKPTQLSNGHSNRP
jgi:hypothetical protein